VAPGAGMTVRAVASQPRPHFHAGTARAFARRPRGEHAILVAPQPGRAPRATMGAPPQGPRGASPETRGNPERIRRRGG
jgi:hypothetical protein